MLTRQLCHGGGRMEADLKLIKINYLVWESVLQIKWADVPQCRTSPGGLLSRAGSHRGCWALQEHHRAISAWNTKMFVQLLWFLHTTGATWAAVLSCPTSGAIPTACRDTNLLFLHQKTVPHDPLYKSVSASQAWPHPGSARVGCGLMKVRLREGS